MRSQRNPMLCVAIVSALAVGMLSGTWGMIWLAAIGREIPQALVGITYTCGGAIAGALAVTPLQWRGPHGH